MTNKQLKENSEPAVQNQPETEPATPTAKPETPE